MVQTSISQFKIEKNKSLADLTTFKIGGAADFFTAVNQIDDLIKAVEYAQGKNLPFFILGQGSNVLFSDSGFSGLIIKNNCRNFSFSDNILSAESGAGLQQLVLASVKNNLSGLEWAFQIPGTLGGAIRGNAGAYGSDISKIVLDVLALDEDLNIKRYQNPNLNFSCRGSIFKENNNIILSANLSLEKRQPNLELLKDIGLKRKKKIPIKPSAGCIFKNPKNQIAAKLIEACNLKGKIIGQAQISNKHANFIVNLGGAKSQDVIQLMQLAKEKVKDKFNIELEEEIIII